MKVIGAGKRLIGSERTLLGVTSGVTWGKPTFAPASLLYRASSAAEHQAADSYSESIDGGSDASKATGGLRGNFVETTTSAEGGGAPKSLKMVGATGIEPVTPTMSR